MAITDNNFTPEELTGALTANPELLNTITGHLRTSKYVVQSEDEHQRFIKNHEDTVIGPRTKEFATRIEQDVKELTGIDKEGDEKYFDYMKRAFGAKLGGFEKVSKELEELRKTGNPSQADRDRIKLLEDAIAAKEKDFGEKLTAKEREVQLVKASQIVGTAVAALRAKYKEGLPKELVELSEGTVINQILGEAEFIKDSSGTEILAFKDKDGKVRLNASILPMTIEERLQETALKSMLDEAKVKTGTGSQEQKGKDVEPGKFVSLPADVKTKTQATEYLKKLGILQGTKEFDDAFASDMISKLPTR